MAEIPIMILPRPCAIVTPLQSIFGKLLRHFVFPDLAIYMGGGFLNILDGIDAVTKLFVVQEPLLSRLIIPRLCTNTLVQGSHSIGVQTHELQGPTHA